MMTSDLRTALDRTLLLMRDEVTDAASDEALLAALIETEVALTADAQTLVSHAAQCTYVTAAILMARSGHKVYLIAPDLPMAGPQPPLINEGIVTALLELGRDLLPGVEFSAQRPTNTIDLEVCLGGASPQVAARRTISVGASAWSGHIRSRPPAIYSGDVDSPFGGMAGGALAAGEAFKAAMNRLRCFALSPAMFNDLFFPTSSVTFSLSPGTPQVSADLGVFEVVSGGAIANAELYALGRIKQVKGLGRVIDDDHGDLTNLNRNMLLRRSMVPEAKAEALAALNLGNLKLRAVAVRYDSLTAPVLDPLARYVTVGVDHIPTRWAVQRSAPYWLGIGATSHWSAMASHHFPRGGGCAACLHPTDDAADGPIPTVAYVSFWAGLLLAAQFALAASCHPLPLNWQQTYITPLRPETPWRSPVARRENCAICGVPSRRSRIG
jgi:hypothetical protein